MTEPLAGPLEGMRVLDLTTGAAGPYATKLLADFGAAVTKLEPPGGDPSRAEPPFFHDEPHVEGAIRFLHLNTNKRSAIVDLGSPRGHGARRRAARPGSRTSRRHGGAGLGYADSRARGRACPGLDHPVGQFSPTRYRFRHRGPGHGRCT
jgi:hypothetical protein